MSEDKSPAPATKTFCYGVTNPNWISLKAAYLVAGAAIAACFPFMVPFFKSLGLTVAQIGILEFVHVVISVFSTPMIGTIADKSGRHSLVLTLCIAVFTIPMTSLALFSPPTGESLPATLSTGIDNKYELEVCGSNTVERFSNITNLFVSSKSNHSIDQLVCKDFHANVTADLKLQSKLSKNNCSIYMLELAMSRNESTKCEVEFRIENSDNFMTFLWLCLIRAVSALTMGPTLALMDSISYDMLGPENRQLWGQQRMFLAVGFAMTGGIMGVILDHFNTFRIGFITFGVFCTIAACIALFLLPKRLHHKKDGDKEEERVPFCKALRAVLASPIFCITCVVAITTGMLASVMAVVWPQHLTELGASRIEFGMIPVFICVMEIPSFFFSGAIIDRIGESVCLILVFSSYIIRMGANAFLTPETVWLALPIEATHIFCFVLFFSSATRIGATIAPPGTTSTVQAAVATSFSGIGIGSGVLLVSFIYHTFGRFYSFLIYASFAFFALVILLIVYFVYFRNAMIQFVKLQKEKEAKQKDELSPNNPLMSDANMDEL